MNHKKRCVSLISGSSMKEKKYSETCAKRKFFRDRKSNIVNEMEKCLRDVVMMEMTQKGRGVVAKELINDLLPTTPAPRMRFLSYDHVGGKKKNFSTCLCPILLNPFDCNNVLTFDIYILFLFWGTLLF